MQNEDFQRLPAKLRDLINSYGSLASLLLFYFIVFHKPLLLGKCISKIGECALRNGVFRSDSLPAPLYPDFDPCIYVWYLPVRDFISSTLAAGKLPLWDAFRGAGNSDLSHPSLSLLNPVLMISPLANEYVYGAALVLQSFVAAIGAWLICRRLGLGHWSSFWSAAALGLSCRILAGLELALFDCLVPWIFLSVHYLFEEQTSSPVTGKQKAFATPTGVKIILVAMLWAFGFLSMHLEVFVITLFTTLFAFVLDAPITAAMQKKPIGKSTGRLVLLTAVSGILSMALVAPLLVPMIKHLQACDFYKINCAAANTANIVNVLRDAAGWKGFDGAPLHSLYCGALTCLLAPCAFLFPVISHFTRPITSKSAESPPVFGRELQSAKYDQLLQQEHPPTEKAPIAQPGTSALASMVRILAIVTVITVARVYPNAALAEWLSHPPIQWLAPQYFLPLAVLSICLLSGYSLESITRQLTRSQKILASFAIALGPALAVAALSMMGAAITCKPATALISISAIALFGCILWTRGLPRAMFLCAVVGFNLVSLAIEENRLIRIYPQIKQSLHLPNTLLSIAGCGDRIASCGGTYLVPNIAGIFGINQVDLADPLTPKGHSELMQAAGAQYDGFHWGFSRFPSKSIHITGVKYLVARGPIVPAELLSQNDLSSTSCPDRNVFSASKAGIVPGLRISGGWFKVDKTNKQIYGILQAKIHPLFRTYASPIFFAGITDGTGKIVEESEMEWDHALPEKKPIFVELKFALGIPDQQKNFQLVLRVDNKITHCPLPSCSTKERANNNWTYVSNQIDVEPLPPGPPNVSWLTLKASADGGHRLYKIEKPLPMMFFVAQSQSDLASKTPSNAVNSAITLPTLSNIQSVDWNSAAPHQYKASVDATTSGELVLMQSFFPGWSATIDGRPAEIHRADYAFQSVTLPAGRHTVRFWFVPPGLAPGLAIFCGGSLLILAIIYKSMRVQKLLIQNQRSTAAEVRELQKH